MQRPCGRREQKDNCYGWNREGREGESGVQGEPGARGVSEPEKGVGAQKKSLEGF